ncbi:Do family serine endopeptidase [Cytophagales bacterium LB-30]|uniref:Do family serine endopeptidase n=1 Tax=Shiella aurantiaca TaxID=3058365 RepID=A0ABT8F7F8_9BACT|nr:Do family serine endopeptidase [Shiella aurantiaca]MDN4166411.1 Do family serine endopeptidase [Shiella aurantiaca]
MNNSKFFLSLVLSSIFGGFIALAGFSYFSPKAQMPLPTSSGNQVKFTNFLADSAFTVPEGLNFLYAAEVATPAVVHVRSTVDVSSAHQYQNPMDDVLRDFFGDSYPQNRPRNYGQAMSSGSGVILSADGYIVTNNHVIENASEIEVVMNDNRSFQAKVVGTDPSTDIALLKIDGDELPYLTLGNSDKTRIGEWVLAVGNPFNLNSTVTAGIVSAKARNINILRDRNGLQIESFIQTDAAVNPGNSGGALVNLKGELVGVNTAIATQTGTFSGYSFAVPASLVRKVVEDLREYGIVQRALLGVQIIDMNAQVKKQFSLKETTGIYISAVNEGSAADEAGIQEGDVIQKINDKEVFSVAQLQEQIALKRPGDKVQVGFSRDGKFREIEVELKGVSGSTQFITKESGATLEGATFGVLPEETLADLELEGGVEIKELEDGKWKEAGIKEGFIITAIDKMEVRTVQDVMQILQNKKGGVLIEGVYPTGERAFYGVGW